MFLDPHPPLLAASLTPFHYYFNKGQPPPPPHPMSKSSIFVESDCQVQNTTRLFHWYNIEKRKIAPHKANITAKIWVFLYVASIPLVNIVLTPLSVNVIYTWPLMEKKNRQTWITWNELIYQNAAVLQHFWAKSIQRFYLRWSVWYGTVYYAPLFMK